MDIFNVLTMIGGLALFLYGMEAMGGGLSKMAGGRMEEVLEKLTSKRIAALLLGAGVTAVIQSSSATTVMVVGFVNSGIMQLERAVGIIMGANVGTTVTSWILSLTGIQGSNIWVRLLKPSSFSPILAAVGIILTMTAKESGKKRDVGNILLGFAILMFGMETMSSAVSPLADTPEFVSFFTKFSNPILGLAAGAILTAVIQSSSASVGILQALCVTGAVSFGAAIPIIMGQNIGTCVTSIISSIGAKKNAKRAAMIHLFFNLIGTIGFMFVFYGLNKVLHFSFLETAASPAGIAVVHSLFNIASCVVLYPAADLLVKLARFVIPDKVSDDEDEQVEENRVILDERFLERPAFAMEVSRNMAKKMAFETQEAIQLALKCLELYDDNIAELVIAKEKRIDSYEDALGSYLVRLSARELSAKDGRSMSVILHGISDFERISDHAVNLVEAAGEMHARGLTLSDEAKQEIDVLKEAVIDIVGRSVKVFCEEDTQAAVHIEPLEQVVDSLTKKIKQLHVKRLKKQQCNIRLGVIFEDILINMERVSDHCSNIAVDLLAIEDDGTTAHEYYEHLTDEERLAFDEDYRGFKSIYHLS